MGGLSAKSAKRREEGRKFKLNDPWRTWREKGSMKFPQRPIGHKPWRYMASFGGKLIRVSRKSRKVPRRGMLLVILVFFVANPEFDLIRVRPQRHHRGKRFLATKRHKRRENGDEAFSLFAVEFISTGVGLYSNPPGVSDPG